MRSIDLVEATADKGPLMSAKQIANDPEFFNGTVDEQFVRRHVPGRVQFSARMIRWYRNEVVQWIESKRPKQEQQKAG